MLKEIQQANLSVISVLFRRLIKKMSYSSAVETHKKKTNTLPPIQRKGSIQSSNEHLKDLQKRNQQSSAKPDLKHQPLSRHPSGKKCQLLCQIPKLTYSLYNLTIAEETDEEKKERLTSLLSKFESPFTWKPVYKRFNDKNESIIVKLQDKDDEIVDEKKFKWRNFVLKLVISYELYRANQVSDAMVLLVELEKTLIENTNTFEWLYLGVKDALWHILLTSIAFLHLEQNQLTEAEKRACEVQPLMTMKYAALAGIYGVRAAVFMEYGHEGNVRALNAAKTALELDNTCAEWHFLVGKCMGRIRRVTHCHDIVDNLEIKSIRIAAKKDEDNPLYKVYLGQIIREKTFRDYKTNYPKNGSEERKKMSKAFKASIYKYLEARNLRPDCPHILTRCAHGLMRMPFNLVDLKLVRECLDRAIELAPNNTMTHHIKGLFLERFGVEAEEALTEIKISADLGNFGASMDLIRMRFRLKQGNVVEELEKVAMKYAEPHYMQIAYTQIGSYCLFILYDLVTAVKYFTKVVESDPDSYAMKSHKSLFLRMKDPVNMFELLLEELDKNTNLSSFTPENAKVLKRFRIKLLRYDEAVGEKSRPTVTMLLERAKNLVYKDSTKAHKKTHKKWEGKRSKVFTKSISKKQRLLSPEKEDCVYKSGNKNDAKKRRAKSKVLLIAKSNERSHSVSTTSSVDSDYQRDTFAHKRRELFLSDNSSGSEESTQVNVVNGTLPTRHFSKNTRRMGQNQARDSSVISDSSFKQNYKESDDTKGKQNYHNSRYFIHKTRQSNITDEILTLTMDNLSLKDFQDSNKRQISSATQNSTDQNEYGYSGYFSSDELPRSQTSIMSHEDLTPDECPGLRRGRLSSTCPESKDYEKSVMDRVKQSYSMLNRGCGDSYQIRERNVQRSESSTNINKQCKKSNRSRSKSTQSLNIEIESMTKTFEKLNMLPVNLFMPSFKNKETAD